MHQPQTLLRVYDVVSHGVYRHLAPNDTSSGQRSCMTGHRCKMSSSSKGRAVYHAVQLTFDVFLSYCIFALKKAQCVAMYVNIKQSLLQCLDARLRLG